MKLLHVIYVVRECLITITFDWQLGLDFIKSEEFLVKDIHGDGCRHILFATKYQLSLLCETRIWYMDGTF